MGEEDITTDALELCARAVGFESVPTDEFSQMEGLQYIYGGKLLIAKWSDNSYRFEIRSSGLCSETEGSSQDPKRSALVMALNELAVLKLR